MTILKTEFFRPYCVSYLDQILLRTENAKAKLCSTYPNANQYLNQCGFEFLPDDCEFAEAFPQKDILRLKRFYKNDFLETEVIEWIRKNIIKFLPTLSKELEAKIIKNFWEIIYNAMDHSGSNYGVSICGQFYPKKGYFEIAFCDIGKGIPHVVKENIKKLRNTNDADCIKWSMEEGTTTKPANTTGGLGLYLLRQFIKINSGAFQIVSNSGYYGHTENSNQELSTLKNFISGTLVNLRVNYNFKSYKLKQNTL